MHRTRLHQALLLAVIGSAALVGCEKKEDAASTATATEAAAAPAAPAAPAAVATASIAAVDIGNATDAEHKVTAATTSFKPNDTVHVSIATATSDPAATVAGKVGTRLTRANGAEEVLIADETRDLNMTDKGSTNFQFAQPGGWPAGKYKLVVTLDGNVVQTKEFEVAK